MNAFLWEEFEEIKRDKQVQLTATSLNELLKQFSQTNAGIHDDIPQQQSAVGK